ncbi:hypothetical protein PPSIR1_38024 [Plesiocystis pacifica SIR-1]|uniref:RNA polymerase sigma factor 70 region 4 type 2 domain-containing protein n=1 Tax=Plesiocystis pacifica SIR-1 TaxID=391625 RepID=A6G9P4_9BACT|nr:sigma-70 family RNA polymerase sigma factor [Plesiocystis pacifica]EDM77438.1 hypothetical protein PPSIR1_38024 [Plesiocystis pacifica SIR-1]
MDDEVIIALLRGDQAAMEAFFRRHYRWALGYARRRGAGEDAADIVHDVFADLFERPPNGLGKVADRAVLAVMISDRVKWAWRKATRARKVPLLSDLLGPGTDLSALARRRRLGREVVEAMARLGTTQRRLLEQRFFEDVRAVDIAAQTGRTAAAVRAAVFRAQASLRMELGLKGS